MASQTVNIDLTDHTPDQQVNRLKEQYVLLRGKGVVVRARVGELPYGSIFRCSSEVIELHWKEKMVDTLWFFDRMTRRRA